MVTEVRTSGKLGRTHAEGDVGHEVFTVWMESAMPGSAQTLTSRRTGVCLGREAARDDNAAERTPAARQPA